MAGTIYRFELSERVALDDAEESVRLAALAAEGLFGGAGVRMDASYTRIDDQRAILVDGATQAGAAVARILAVFLEREFGDDSFEVVREDKAVAGVGGRPQPAAA